ncbi:MAG: sensor histidine kinase [Gemmatimonadales bacterium]
MQEECGPGEESPERTIREATRHLVRSLELLDRVLRAPVKPSDPAPVSIRELLEFLGALHRILRSSVTLDLTSVLSQSLPAITATEEHLEHALLNVLMNAIEACAERQDSRIAVTATAGGGRVVLDFADNGPGLAPEVGSRLFEPFVTTKARRPMAGLGLAVARELLGRTGGTLEYEPRKPDGSLFVVTLPVWR